MHNPHHPHAPPMRDGVGPSCVVLPSQGQGSMLDFLAQRLPVVTRDEWLQRMQAGDVVDV
jgi:tRNA pseudouridine32 synthase / 23S rRNA pseudouridine746 synthase